MDETHIEGADPPLKNVVPTIGEILAGGALIELVRDYEHTGTKLILFDGANETLGSVVEHNACRYSPKSINASVLRQLTLPTNSSPHGSTREFFSAICNLIENFVGIPQDLTGLVARLVLGTAVIDALSVAPTMIISGTDIARGNQLMALLNCLCRHTLQLTRVTPAGLCSLPSGARFTYLLSQTSLSNKLLELLSDATRRDQKIPFRGGLLDLFGTQVIHCGSGHIANSWRTHALHIPIVPIETNLPILDIEAQLRISNEFQPQLLSFRRANLHAACRSQFDASKLSLPLRPLACSLAAATPGDSELQAEVLDLLQEHDAEIRSDRWIDLSTVALESIVVAGQESPGKPVYVSDLAQIAQEILKRRGEGNAEVNPSVLGTKLKELGFPACARDSKGKKLLVTAALLNQAKQMVQHLKDTETGQAVDSAVSGM